LSVALRFPATRQRTALRRTAHVTQQIGFPLQYNQYPLLRTLWNIRFMAQVLAHKVLPALVSPPLFLMIQDPAQSYSSVLAATERSRAMLAVLAAALVAALAWLVRAAAAHFAGAGAVAA
jgi:hypothetical protein